jgi:DNA-binding transcriptional LysR family regulator
MALPRSSIEQWAVLAAVIDRGGFAQAAAALNRSQSAVSYAVARLQQTLDVPLLRLEGRRAVLTPHGETLLKRSRALVSELGALEQLARTLKQGWEPQLQLAVDAAFPRQQLLEVFAELNRTCPQTQLQFTDVVLSGAEEAILEGTADVVVTTQVPSGLLGELLLNVTFVAVASPQHPLFALGRAVNEDDLRRHVQVVVQDSGRKQRRDLGWLGAERRCTVTSVEASLATVLAGLAYAWLPEHLIATPLAEGRLRRLPLEFGARRALPLYLVLVHTDRAGPAARAAVDSFRRHAMGAVPAPLKSRRRTRVRRKRS